MIAHQRLPHTGSATPVPSDLSTHPKRAYLTGVEALVRLPVDQIRRDNEAGLKTQSFISGYPGSPLGGYDMALDRAKIQEHGILHVRGQNEELAATAILGTQMLDGFDRDEVDGVVSFWYGKGPGADRSGDAFKHGNFAGTSKHGAVVLLSGEDHEAKSSSVPYQQEFGFEHSGIPVLYPASVSEFLEYGFHAVAMSRYSGCWVALKLVGPLCDGGEVVDFDKINSPVLPRNLQIEGKPFSKSTDFNFFPVLNVGTEARLYNERHQAVLAYSRVNELNRIVCSSPNDRIGVIAAGKSFVDTRGALADLGLSPAQLSESGIRLAKVGLLCPGDDAFFLRFSKGLDLIIVVEEKRDFLERQVAKAVAGHTQAKIVGKRDLQGNRLFPVEGGADVDIVSDRLARVLGDYINIPEAGEKRVATVREAKAPAPKLFASRAPNYCSGCPHNRSTKLADGQIAWGAPGCHVFAAIMEQPERRIEAMTQYGGEGLPWIGLSPFTTKKHIVQNVGDGSYYHSSHQNIRFAVSTGQRMTFRILYNGVIANTGGQQYAADNSLPKLCRQLALDGVKKIVLTTKEPGTYRNQGLPEIVELRTPDAVPDALKKLEEIDGVTILIYDGDCANERRRRQKRGKAPKPVKFTIVNEDVCENCGDCGRKANCMSLQKVETPFGLKTQVHQSSCNQDRACVDGECPSFISVDVEEGGGPGLVKAPDIANEFPEPQRPGLERPYSIYIPGVGGTGVITLNALLARAAVLNGLNVKTYDQTGAAQKWGAVLSSIIVSRADDEIIGNKVSTRKADLYLAVDMVAGADNVNLSVCDTERTVAAASAEVLPTGEMVRNVFFQPDKPGMLDHIARSVRQGCFVHTPALTIAERLFGNYILSNMVTVGAAYQAGYLPISAESIEEAIESAGTAAKLNILAFRAGRMSVADPDRMSLLLRRDFLTLADRTYAAEERWPTGRAEKLDTLLQGLPDVSQETRQFIRQRASDLMDYQSASYARAYVEKVSRIALAEKERAPSPAEPLTLACARYLHKVMAYKDEYEVARLLTDPVFETRLKDAFRGMKGYRYNLQPPTFRGLFPERKIEVGTWFRPALRLLCSIKALRGTAFDPFGRNPARKAERDAIAWYKSLIDLVVERLTPTNAQACAELLALPEDVRGYEDLKINSLKQAKERAAAIRGTLEATAQDVEARVPVGVSGSAPRR